MAAKDKPFQELRFTRARQASVFVVAGMACLAASLVLFGLWVFSDHGTPGWWWSLVPLLPSWGCLRLAAHLTKHAYLLFSPIGIEIFPFFRPAQSMQLVSWGEISEAAVSPDQRLLTLTMAGYQDRKIIISLDPVPVRARALLAKAVAGIMEKRAAGTDAGALSASDTDADAPPAGAKDSSRRWSAAEPPENQPK